MLWVNTKTLLSGSNTKKKKEALDLVKTIFE